MPLFEYVCKECDKRFEALVYGAQSAHCPECKSADLAQLISVFSVGSGRSSFTPASPCASGGPCCGGQGGCGFDS